MPRKESRVRIERGLYRSGKVYLACATPMGSRKVVWKKLGAVGLMEARRLRDEFAAQTRRAPAAPVRRRMTYGEIVQEWLTDQEARVAAGDLASSTLEGYHDELKRHILPVFGDRQILSITPDDLVRWHRDMQRRGLSAWSIKHAWAPLRLVLRYAVRHYGLPGNPADSLLPQERPKPGEDRKRFLNRTEITSLLQVAVDPYRLPIATAIFSGLRIGELLGLTWQEVDFKAGVIKVRFQATRPGERARLKTPAARRDVILMPELGSDLRKHRLASPFAQPADIVFASKVGTSPNDRNVANRGLKVACREAGLEGVSFHALRHTFASILIAQGHDVVFVSRQLGHANAAITLKVYAHLFDAARHAETARQRLDEDYRAVLRRREEPGRQLGFDL